MRGLKISLWIGGTLALLGTLAPLIRLRGWWVRAFDFPRVQLAVTLLAVIAAYVVVMLVEKSDTKRWPHLAFVAALLGGLVMQLVCIVPYTPLAAPQAKRADALAPNDPGAVSLLVANVLMDNREAQGLVALVRKEAPDLLLVVESDRWWLEQLAELHDVFPHRVEYPLDNTYGIALYSSLPLIDPHVDFVIEPDVPSIRTRVRLRDGHEVQLHCLHPRPPGPHGNEESTERDAELLVVAAQAKAATIPVIVAGDLNDVAWSHTTRRFQRISSLLDPRIGRGVFSTYDAQNPLVRWPLDHAFFSSAFELVEMRRLDAFGSDHFPILLRLHLEPSGAAQHEDPEPPTGEDRSEAAEVLGDAKSKRD